jgi:HAD superfamily hydrolase (TIGR01490 family)
MHGDNGLSTSSRRRGLALFDLDHTLIDFDSGGAFTRWLADRGVLSAEFQTRYLAYCQDYAAGRLDIRAMHRHTVGTLAAYDAAQLDTWLQQFEGEVARRIRPAARALVQRHQQRGDLCALVTATTRFIAEPFARLFGITHVLATEPARDAQGRLTGEVIGEPCFRRHKCGHVEQWLGGQGLALADFDPSRFYSDSFHDLPLLQAVRHPVVVDGDAALTRHAQAQGWELLSLR